MKINRKIIYYITSVLLPNFFLFILFNNNKVRNNLYFSHFVVLSIFFSIISVCIYIIYRKITKCMEGALLALLVSWIFFWQFEIIRDAIIDLLSYFNAYLTRGIIILILFGLIALLLYIIRRYSAKIERMDLFFLVSAIAICILFIFNFTSALYTNVILISTRSSASKPYEIKTEFIVDNSLPSPDIYWFHMDEMMGFNAINKYFGDSLDDLKNNLKKRGFVINENAELRAGYTSVAVPALLSPKFFDSYLGEHLANVDNLLRSPRNATLNTQFALDGLSLKQDIEPYYETIKAFKSAEYTTVLIACSSWRTVSDYHYNPYAEKPLIKELEKDTNAVDDLILKAFDLINLFLSTTSLSLFYSEIYELIYRQWQHIPEYENIINMLTDNMYGLDEEKKIYITLYDSLSIKSPKFVYVSNLISHDPYDKIYVIEGQENPSPDNPYAVDLLYMPQYKYAAKVMLNKIDMIIERNQDAIIIIQGDHGIHSYGHQYLINEGFPESQILEMLHSVISAVRIPPQYGILDEPLNPLNISRLLVNKFVGENYTILDN